MQQDVHAAMLIERVAAHVRCHHAASTHVDDIEQVARIAAWRAYERADLRRRGWRSYVYRCAEGAARRYLRDHVSIVRVSRRAYERGVRVDVVGLEVLR
jgi:DNA-directed RNA polymerase specialized sigma subunit